MLKRRLAVDVVPVCYRRRRPQLNSCPQFSHGRYFGNVCELDIVFNFQQVYRMLDELIIGGEVLEISKRAIYK